MGLRYVERDRPTTVIPRLKTRAEFVHVATGRRWSSPNLTLQAAPRKPRPAEAPSPAEDMPRLGFTVTKKIGQAVTRNRVRRRLKGAVEASAARLIGEGLAKPGHDYVIVARAPGISTPFPLLIDEIAAAFAGVHRARSSAISRA